jgi:cytoskeleton protein RodZ
VFEIGISLREARLRKQIELPEAEQGTKIRGKYLRALEDEQFELLPAQTYVKGFLRSYAEYLGLDGQLYVDEYNSRYVIGEEGADQPFRARRREAPRARTRAHRRFEKSVVVLALVAIAVVTALVIAAWKFGGSSGSQKIPNLGAQKTQQPGASATPVSAPRKLVLRAVRSGTYVAVHQGSPTGKILFQGTLQSGHPLTFAARTVWMNVDSPENLRVTLAGRALRVPRPHNPVTILITRTGRVRTAA